MNLLSGGRASRAISLHLMGMVLALAPIASYATDLSGSSSGYGVDSSLSILALNLNVGPNPVASGNAPAAYNQTNSLASVSGNALLLSLETGLLSSSASSNVDGSLGSKTTGASSYVDNANFGIAGILALGGSASVIGSNAAVSGDYGALNAGGSATLTNVTLNVLGTNLYVPVNPTANTILYNLGGLEIVLNEQLVTGDGIGSAGIQDNAIDFKFTNFAAGLDVVNGDLIIGQSEANMIATPTPAPEPVTWGALAFAVLLGWRRSMASRRLQPFA